MSCKLVSHRSKKGQLSMISRQSFAQPLLLLLWLAMGAFPGFAQTGASLSGVVTDPNGAPLPGVAVTIKNADTGETRNLPTDGRGYYQTSGVPPGRWEIRAPKPGFADETRAGITVAAGQEATADIK